MARHTRLNQSKTMNTPHIKRFEERGALPPMTIEQGSTITMEMLNDLAEHIERLEQRFEEHRHNFPTGHDHNGHETTEQTFPPVSTD